MKPQIGSEVNLLSSYLPVRSEMMLKLENLLRWSFFTFTYCPTTAVQMWIISYILHIIHGPIGHFRVLLFLCFKTSLNAKPFVWKWVLHAVSFSCKSKNGLALRLNLKQRHKGTRQWPIALNPRASPEGWRRGGLMVSLLDSASSGPGSSPYRGHCVLFLGKTLYSHSASEFNAGGNPVME